MFIHKDLIFVSFRCNLFYIFAKTKCLAFLWFHNTVKTLIVWWYSHICHSNFWGGSVLDNDDDRTEQTRQKHQQQEVIDNKDVASLRARKVFDPPIPPPGDTNKVIVTANISVEDLKEKLDSLMERVNDGVNSRKCTLLEKWTKNLLNKTWGHT